MSLSPNFGSAAHRSDLNEGPKTYVDQPRDRFPGFNRSNGGPSRIHPERMDEYVGENAHRVVYEKLDETLKQGNVCFQIMDDIHYRALMANKPKDLDHAVITKYQPIDFDGLRYRFDNIFYNNRCFLRLVVDVEATERFAAERMEEMYDGLIDKQSEKLLTDVIREIFADANKDQTTQILEAVALLKKKEPAEKKESLDPSPAGLKEHVLTSQVRTDRQQGPFSPGDAPKMPAPFYVNKYFVGLMAEQYMVHNHPTLGFLIAL